MEIKTIAPEPVVVPEPTFEVSLSLDEVKALAGAVGWTSIGDLRESLECHSIKLSPSGESNQWILVDIFKQLKEVM